MPMDKSTEVRQSEILGRVSGNIRVAPNAATIKDTEVMIPRLKYQEGDLGIRVKLD